MNFDLVLLNGWVLDAADSNITKQDIGITSGRISFLGDISKIAAYGAEKKLDIKNKLVIPGLIDCHTHHVPDIRNFCFNRHSDCIPVN